MEIVVIGFGKSGKSAARLAKSCGYAVTIVDENSSEKMFDDRLEFIKDNIEVELGVSSCDLTKCVMIVQSPGVPPDSALATFVEESGIEVVSEIEFAAMNTEIPMLAVTGTNGKTTTTELSVHILNRFGYNTAEAGNIGTTLSEVVQSGINYDFIVVEVSSFQLEKSPNFAPTAAVITNVTSDHLDRHGNIDNYTKIKFDLFSNIENGNNKIINVDLFPFWNENISSEELPILFSAKAEADFKLEDDCILFNGKKVIDMADLQLSGPHNAENIMAALGLVRSVLGDEALFKKKLQKAVADFKVGDHRVEAFEECDGVVFVDDSKGTNPDAVVAALNSIGGDKNVCLILGGLDKGMDFSPILAAADKIKEAFVIGECRAKIAKVLEGEVKNTVFDDFESAVLSACETARSGDAVMLSPACASMDMFSSYKERGEVFKQIIREKLGR